VNGEMPARLILVRTDQKSNRKQRSTGGNHDKNENQKPTQILLLG
jgi:hypothetical protein